MMHAIRCCPEDCRYRIEDCDWMCRDEVNHFAHCPTVDKKWKRFAIGEFGEKIHAPRGVSITEACARYYQRKPSSSQGKAQAPVPSGVKQKAAVNLFDDFD